MNKKSGQQHGKRCRDQSSNKPWRYGALFAQAPFIGQAVPLAPADFLQARVDQSQRLPVAFPDGGSQFLAGDILDRPVLPQSVAGREVVKRNRIIDNKRDNFPLDGTLEQRLVVGVEFCPDKGKVLLHVFHGIIFSADPHGHRHAFQIKNGPDIKFIQNKQRQCIVEKARRKIQKLQPLFGLENARVDIGFAAAHPFNGFVKAAQFECDPRAGFAGPEIPEINENALRPVLLIEKRKRRGTGRKRQ